jgi:pyruvate/2-oxoglutarate dehydrogenase complex dihydrolipoamide acyltransferase (E2) component
MVDVVFPTMSTKDPDAEGVLATWFVREGERVTADQLVAEVQVDKVSMEVPAPTAGAVHLLVAEEAVVTQGSVIATIQP